MPKYPNWPGDVPDTSGAVKQPVVVTTVAPVPVLVAPPQAHVSIQGARAAGAEAGTLVTAPLAPASGPITNVPQVIRATDTTPAKEPMVVVAVKSFWDSPTIKAARNVIATALTAVVGVFAEACVSVWLKGQSIFAAGAIDWKATEVTAEVSAGLIIASAFLAWKKTRDNNPVQ